jgi:hypothetical protein
MAYREYTEEEKLEFRRKDKRMSLSGLVQAIMHRCKTSDSTSKRI